MRKIVFALMFIFCFPLFAANFNKIIVVYKPDSTVAIIHPAIKVRIIGETDTQFLTRIYQETTENTDLEGLPYDILYKSDLPDREDRDAWEGEVGSGVEINIPKAKVLKKAKRRNDKIKGRAMKNADDEAEAELIAEGEIE